MQKLCECGCGQTAPIAKMTNRRDGVIAGQPRRFVHGHNPFGKTAIKPGDCFGRLLVLSRAANRRQRAHWACRCNCGAETEVDGSHLANGHTKSCGCLQRDVMTETGASRTPAFKAWWAAKQRCGNPNNKQFKDYGGRGIKMCRRWFNSFSNFLTDMGQPPSGLQLERKHNNRGYSPKNCVWATRTAQMRNRRNNRWFTYEGRRGLLGDFAKQFGHYPQLVRRRLETGWSLAKALRTPVRAAS